MNLAEVAMVDKTDDLKAVIVKLKDENLILEKRLDTSQKVHFDKSNDERSVFLDKISHEIRTPINTIIGMTHLCQQSELNQKQHSYLKKAHEAELSLLNVFNEMLDYFKIEINKLHLEPRDFYLAEVMDKLTSEVANKAHDKGLELIFDIDSDLPDILQGDPYRLQQVLINLATNAIEHTDKGDITITITKDSDGNGEVKLRFSVCDTGRSLNREQIDRLFRPFVPEDIHAPRRNSGAGLGMLISKHLVQLMDGELWVNSKQDFGNEFIFTATLDVRERIEKKILVPKARLKDVRALVVDDNESAGLILKSLLESLSMDVSVVKSAEESFVDLEIAEKVGRPYDILFMD